jgi:hypothetical protein
MEVSHWEVVMVMPRTMLLIIMSALVAACTQDSGEPNATLGPSFAKDGAERQTIVVNPNASGNGVAATIQEGVDRVASGGTVLIKAGLYAEAVVIDKGLTLQAIGDGNGAVLIAPNGTVPNVIDVATTEPVTIQDLTLQYTGTNGIGGLGAVDVTVDHVSVIALNQPGAGNLITVIDDAADGTRARLVVRNSFLDGGINNGTPPLPQLFGLRVQGDVDAWFETNAIRRVGGACIFAFTRFDLGGAVNVEILNNDLDECHPTGRVAAILVGPAAGNLPSPTRPVTATGVVNIIGNRIRNSSVSCLPASAIAFEVGSGRIENNHITSYVQSCAIPTGRNLQGAIFVGRRQHPLFPAVNVSVRFNDINGNAFAGLRLGANQSRVIDASCNYWGSSDGPSGVGSGSGDAVIVEPGAAQPVFSPFATAPIAGTGATSCE